jgi:hypothetical protein
MSEPLFQVLESYRSSIKENPDLLVSLHLFNLSVFATLEDFASKENNKVLEEVWSSIGGKIIKISLAENEE